MADFQSRLRAHEVFWSRDESDADTSLVQVPGVQDPGNRRPTRSTKVKCRKTQEIKPVVPLSRKPVSQAFRPPPPSKVRATKHASKPTSSKNSRNQEEDNTRPHKASLKELCPEDKQRVANLINELARVGEEKEKFAYELNSERTNFDARMKGLSEQHERILGEREGVQRQLLECQRLLARYQNLVSEQQDGLNSSSKKAPETQDVPAREREHVGQLSNHHTRGQHEEKGESCGTSQVQNTNVKADAALTSSQAGPSENTSRRPLSPASRCSSEAESGDLTPRGSKKRTLPSSVQGDRPFTTYIDSLIASEQNGSKPDLNVQSKKDKSGGSSSQAPSSGSKRSSIGPLHEPVLSSTHQSDSLSVSNQSRTKAGAFRPLQPDSSPRSSLLSSGAAHPLDAFNPLHVSVPQNGHQELEPSYHNQGPVNYGPVTGHNQHSTYHSVDGGQPGEARVTFSDQLLQPSPQGHHQPAGLPGDDEFITHYKAMTSAERQHHLMTQKAALLAEQQRLRQILEEQEQLLCTKQDQLRYQQDIQKIRLEHFEKNGYFPPEPVSMDPPEPRFEAFSQAAVSNDQMNQYHPYREVQDHGSQPGTFPQADSYPDRSPGFDPRSKPFPINDPHSTFIPLPPNPNMTQKVNPTYAATMTNSSFEVCGTLQGTNGPELSREEIEAVSDSMENLWFLQKHGIEVPHVHKHPYKKGHRSPVSSTLRPGGGPSPSHRVQTLEELINAESSDASTERLDVPHRPSVHSNQWPTHVTFKGIDRDHAACLLDLVNQVESSHGGRPSPASASRRRPDPAIMEDIEYLRPESIEVSEEAGEEEEEESRILEEVFFVR